MTRIIIEKQRKTSPFLRNIENTNAVLSISIELSKDVSFHKHYLLKEQDTSLCDISIMHILPSGICSHAGCLQRDVQFNSTGYHHLSGATSTTYPNLFFLANVDTTSLRPKERP